ncbi:hypothetical protein BGZ81_002075 [Podila clonocystis]|nr:hypothetical protein BGZ81_002075 [Podila clonocystis]
MTSIDEADSLVLQRFESEDGTALASLSTQVCTETGDRYLLWGKIQLAFEDIDHLEYYLGSRGLFMVNKNDELFDPLRVGHYPYFAYTVVNKRNQGRRRIEESKHIESGTDTQSEGDTNNQNLVHSEIFQPLERLLEAYMELYEQMEASIKLGRDAFRQVATNAQYFRSKLLAEIMRLAIAGVRAQVYGKDRDQILSEIEECDQQILGWEHLTICRSILHDHHHQWDYATSSLFIVLPTDLGSWDDQDPATHQFRLYFLCDNRIHSGSQDMPLHIHLSDHMGYDLKQPREFFQAYGDYVLRVLKLIKDGYCDDNYNVPALDSFDILWSHGSEAPYDQLSMDNITSLIDKAISYLQELSLPKWLSALGMTRSESDAIKAYLEVVDGNDTEGNLHRYIRYDQRVFWVCQAHALQWIDLGSLQHLQEFAGTHGGLADIQHATLKVELSSKSEADKFYNLLTAAGYTFDISVKLNWAASRSEVKKLCKHIARTGTVVLDIDGITLNTHPQNQVQYMTNIFGSKIAQNNGIRLVTLLNYPQPQEQCIYTGMFEVQLTSSPLRSTFSWTDLRMELDKFSNTISYVQAASECKEAPRVLKSTVAKHGLPDFTSITIRHESWDGIFDLEQGAFVEVQSYDMRCPKLAASSAPLQRLIQHLTNVEFDQETYRAVESNAGLKELNISTYGRNVLHQAEKIVQLCQNSSSPLQLTLLDRMPDTRGRVVAQVTIARESHPHANTAALSTSEIYAHPCTLEQSLDRFTCIDPLHWHLRLSDDSAMFLDLITQQHPRVLALITLDITGLTNIGLSSVQNFLKRSIIDRIIILCSPIDPTMTGAIAQVLCSVQWTVLKSLTLLGDNIDEWIQIWASVAAPSLLSLEIRGTGATPHILTHSSTLFLHELVSASPLIELHLENVLLQDKHDWCLIIDCTDPLLLQTCQLCERSINQLMSITKAVDWFTSRFNISGQEGENTRLILDSFTLDISHRSRADLASVQHILSRSSLGHLRVVCTPIDLELAEFVDQVLKAINWRTVISLELSGNSINEWVQFYTSIGAPQLQRLTLRGTGWAAKQLSKSGVQILAKQFLLFCPLVELTFNDIVLQDPDDWEVIVHGINPWVLKDFLMCEKSKQQFLACSIAVDLYNSKYGIGEYAIVDSDSNESDIEDIRAGYSEGLDTDEGSSPWSDESDWEDKGSTHSDNDDE